MKFCWIVYLFVAAYPEVGFHQNRDHKYQKELGDIFVRLFNQVLNLKQFLVSDMSKNNTKTTRKGI